MVDGKPGPTVKTVKDVIKVYPLAWPGDRDNMRFLNYSGIAHNTIHANTIDFYREVHEVISEEPASAFSPELLGLLVAIGIEKGSRFEPNDQLRTKLIESAACCTAIE